MNYALMAGYSMTVLALIATPGPVVLLVTGCAARAGTSSALRTMMGSNLGVAGADGRCGGNVDRRRGDPSRYSAAVSGAGIPILRGWP
jgi:hypothetical protein